MDIKQENCALTYGKVEIDLVLEKILGEQKAGLDDGHDRQIHYTIPV